MRQIIWTNFAIAELKNIFLYHRMVAGDRVANKIRSSIFASTKILIAQPHIGPIEGSLIELEGASYARVYFAQ